MHTNTFNFNTQFHCTKNAKVRYYLFTCNTLIPGYRNVEASRGVSAAHCTDGAETMRVQPRSSGER